MNRNTDRPHSSLCKEGAMTDTSIYLVLLETYPQPLICFSSHQKRRKEVQESLDMVQPEVHSRNNSKSQIINAANLT